jgi:hypothetical protein
LIEPTPRRLGDPRSRLVERLYSTMSPEECKAAMAAGAAWSEQEAFAVAQAV